AIGPGLGLGGHGLGRHDLGRHGWLPQKLPGNSECASFLPQCKIKMGAEAARGLLILRSGLLAASRRMSLGPHGSRRASALLTMRDQLSALRLAKSSAPPAPNRDRAGGA